MEGTAEAALTGCTITEQEGWGTDLRDSSTVQLDGCSLSGNALGALRQRDGTRARIADTLISGGGAGCVLQETSTLELLSSRIASVIGEGLAVEGSAAARVSSSQVIACTSDAIVFDTAGECSVRLSDLVWNEGAGIRAVGGRVEVTDSVIAYNGGDGFAVSIGAEVIADHNNLWANGGEDYVGILPRPTTSLRRPTTSV